MCTFACRPLQKLNKVLAHSELYFELAGEHACINSDNRSYAEEQKRQGKYAISSTPSGCKCQERLCAMVFCVIHIPFLHVIEAILTPSICQPKKPYKAKLNMPRILHNFYN